MLLAQPRKRRELLLQGAIRYPTTQGVCVCVCVRVCVRVCVSWSVVGQEGFFFACVCACCLVMQHVGARRVFLFLCLSVSFVLSLFLFVCLALFFLSRFLCFSYHSLSPSLSTLPPSLSLSLSLSITLYPRSEEHTSELQSHLNLVC